MNHGTRIFKIKNAKNARPQIELRPILRDLSSNSSLFGQKAMKTTPTGFRTANPIVTTNPWSTTQVWKPKTLTMGRQEALTMSLATMTKIAMIREAAMAVR